MTVPDPPSSRDIEALLEDTDSKALLGSGADPQAPQIFELLRLGRRLSQATSEKGVLATLDSALAATVPHRRRAIMLLVDGALEMRHVTGTEADPPEGPALPDDQLRACVEDGSGRAVLLSDGTALMAPIAGAEGVHGVLYLEVVGESDVGDRSPVAGRLEMLVAVAHDAGLALERCRLAAALEASESRYRTLVDQSILGIYCTTPEGEVLLANQAMLDMLGFETLEQLKASGSLEQDSYQPTYARALFKASMERDGYIIGLESAWRRHDGTMAILRENAVAVRNADGEILFYDGTVEDVTEQRRAEDALHALLDSLPLAIVGLDNDGCIRIWNPAAERIFGWTKDEIIGMYYPLAGEQYKQEQEQLLARAIRGDMIAGYETTRQRKDGSLVEVAIWTAGLTAAGGDKISVGVIADVSARRQAEADYRELFEAARDAILIFSPANEVVLDVNRSACEIYGLPRDEFIGRSLIGMSRDPENKRLQVEQTVDAEGGEVRFETIQFHADGSELHLEVSASLVRYQGRPAILSINRDVSERKRLEAQYRQAQKLEALGQLAGGVAHDFNNVLTAIIGYAELAKYKTEETSGARSYLDEISSSAGRASMLARQLLTFSRKQPVRPRPIDLARVIDEMEQMLRLIGSADVELAIEHAPDLPTTRADPGQLQRVVLNLVRNAADAMPDGGPLTVSTRAHHGGPSAPPAGDWVALEVRDEGSGMDADTHSRIFEPFFTTKAPDKGTGLGLATVYGIVQQHEGHIDVQSELGRGTRVIIHLPVTDEAPVADAGGESASGLSEGTETVLLVEDDPVVRRMSRAALEEAGYQVLEAIDGQDALLRIDRDRPRLDLVITDVLMPQIDGPAFADQLAERQPELPLLFVSAFLEEQEQGRLRGRPFLPKPYTPQALTRAVRDLLDD